VKRALAILLAAAMLSACGTTQVVATDQNARIYVDGEAVGKGAGTVRQRGFPGSAQVLVTTEDGRREHQTMSRSFTVVTFFLGLITYGVCWVACWEYPSAVLVNVPTPADGYAAMGTTPPSAGAPAPPVDPWTKPPPGWQPHDAPAAP
jgi:hypothetical protein